MRRIRICEGKILFIVFISLFFLSFLARPGFAWEKMGVFEGNITAVHRTDYFYYVTTEGSGIYRSPDRYNWTRCISGLEELEIVAISSHPTTPNRIYCASASVLYFSNDSGLSWTKLTQIPATIGTRITSLFCTPCSSTSFLYVGTYGSKIWRLNLVTSIWKQISGYFPARVLCLGGYTDGTEAYVFAGAEFDYPTLSINPGGIWRIIDDCSGDFSASYCYGQWISWPSIAVHSEIIGGIGVIGMVLAGSDGNGIAFSIDSGNTFSPYCQDTPADPPPSGRFQALDFWGELSTSSFLGLAGTENMLYCLSGNIFSSCNDGYGDLGFYGNMSAIGVYDEYTGLFGTKGKGLFVAGQTTPSVQSICSTYSSISQTQIPHQHVNRIAISPNYLTDSTIFLASRSEGIYKSVGTGPGGEREFTRYFCHPAAYGPVDILSLALTPGYDDNGSAWLSDCTNDKVILAGSNGYGVFFSGDGGASWYTANSGEMAADAIVMDVEYSPQARITDRVAFAAVWNRGLYISENMGGCPSPSGTEWSLIPCTSNLHIWDISIPYDFVYGDPDYGSVWAATSEGIHQIYRSGSTWYCVLRSAPGPSVPPAWRLDVTKSGGDTLVFFGTPVNGVVMGKWDGSLWTELPFADSYISTTAKIKDLELSGWFTVGNEFVVLYALVYEPSGDMLYGTYYFPSTGLFQGWNPVAVPSTVVQRFTTVSLGPNYTPANLGPVYIGHPFLGMASKQTGGSAWQSGSGYYAYPHEVTATAVDPFFPNLIFSGTSDMGLFISYDGGDSACPFGRYLDYYSNPDWKSTTAITTIATTGRTQVLYETDFSEDPFLYGWIIDDGGGDGISWLLQDGNAGYYGDPIVPCHPGIFTSIEPYMQVDSDCAGSSVTMNEGLITPVIVCTDFTQVFLEFDHYFLKYIYGSERAAIYISTASAPYWQEIVSYTSTTDNPEHVMIDISPWATGEADVMIMFSYENANYDYYWFIDNVKIWGYTDFPMDRNIVIGTEDHGIYTASYSTYASTHNIFWMQANSPSNELSSATISKITDQDLELWASVKDNPAVSTPSPSFISTDFGWTWSPRSVGVATETMFNDIAFDLSYVKHSFVGEDPVNRLLNSGKAQSMFLWAASGGDKIPPYKYTDNKIQSSSKAGPAGAYRYDCDTDIWELRNGTGTHVLSTDLYYTTILSTRSGLKFIGGWSDELLSSIYSGLWRSDNDGFSWYQVNAGLDTHLNAKQITSLLETADGDILLGVNDDTYGGVFMSDSGGYSWARIDDFTAHRGVNSLGQSKTLPAVYYASMVADGSQRTLDLEITGDPVPEFLVDNNPSTLADKTYPSDHLKWFIGVEWLTYTIYSVSAGTISGLTTYSWNIDGEGWVSSGTLPYTNHTFLTGGEKTITMQLNGNSALEQTHHIYIIDPAPPPIADGKEYGSAMTVSKNTTDGSSLTVVWDDYCDPQHNTKANIIYGNLDVVDTYAIDGGECDITPTHTWDIGTMNNIWFVVVSDNDNPNGTDTEGSWGKDSSNQERAWMIGGYESASLQCDCTEKNSTGSCDSEKKHQLP